MDHLCYFCLVFVMLSCVCLIMPCGHVVTCWERADLLALVCGVYCDFVHFTLYPGSGVVLDYIES